MSSALLARRLGQLVSAIVLASSGTYLLVYLYRWEWNRALVAGIFFVAAEVAIAATAILRRLKAIEARLDASAPDPRVVARIREAAPEPRPPFAWLEEQARSTNVFVPVLLGAGVILSVLAAGLERLGAASAVPVLEDRLARRLGRLSLPDGGLLGASAVAPTITRLDHQPPAPRLDRLAVRGFAVLAVALLLVSSIDLLADWTQDRPDPPVTGSVAVTLEVSRRFTGRDPVLTAEALFVACRHTIGDRARADVTRTASPDRVILLVRPAFGEHAQRRFVGCLEDAVFPRIWADVEAVRHVAD
jgi:hypothetical protein